MFFFNWFLRSYFGTVKAMEKVEDTLAGWCDVFLNKWMVWVRDHVILKVLNVVFIIIISILFVPIFVVLIFPSLWLELVVYMSKVRIPKKNADSLDKINNR